MSTSPGTPGPQYAGPASLELPPAPHSSPEHITALSQLAPGPNPAPLPSAGAAARDPPTPWGCHRLSQCAPRLGHQRPTTKPSREVCSGEARQKKVLNHKHGIISTPVQSSTPALTVTSSQSREGPDPRASPGPQLFTVAQGRKVGPVSLRSRLSRGGHIWVTQDTGAKWGASLWPGACRGGLGPENTFSRKGGAATPGAPVTARQGRIAGFRGQAPDQPHPHQGPGSGWGPP